MCPDTITATNTTWSPYSVICFNSLASRPNDNQACNMSWSPHSVPQCVNVFHHGDNQIVLHVLIHLTHIDMSWCCTMHQLCCTTIITLHGHDVPAANSCQCCPVFNAITTVLLLPNGTSIVPLLPTEAHRTHKVNDTETSPYCTLQCYSVTFCVCWCSLHICNHPVVPF